MSCSTRLLASLAASVACLLAVLPLPASAQDGAIPDSITGFASDLRKFARRHAVPGSTAYYSIIRANLDELSRRRMAGTRDIDPTSLPRKRNFVRAKRTLQVDRDPISQRAIDADVDRIDRLLREKPRISGGVEVGTGDHESVALLYSDPENGPICTATYLGGRALLSAAHCVCAFTNEQQQLLDVRVKFARNLKEKGKGTFALTDYRLQHPDYCTVAHPKSLSNVRGRDLAVFYFDAPPDFSEEVLPAQIADPIMIMASSTFKLRLVGYGAIALFDWNSSRVKRQVDVTIADRLCNDPAANNCAPGKEMVLIDAGLERDTCGGDSGGPAFIEVTRSKRFLLAAVTSRATSNSGTCGKGGVYSLITPSVIRWLTDVIQINVTRCFDPLYCAKRPE